ncbi:MAG: TIGR03862 family flavoprotein [Alphaproteobacteria bacterium]|nr:TIGR03862 family flavoprotein [Alphaproteobacteria bacterium]
MTDASKFDVAVIGGGPAGLMAAEVVSRSEAGLRVTVYERMPSVGRKFLMAGRGGLNLTHGEDLATFMGRYGCRQGVLAPIIEAFAPNAARAWCEELGQETFIGTSGRVFPRSMKASPLLRAWLNRLGSQDVAFKVRHRWLGWDDERRLRFETPEGNMAVRADATILALGGGSWGRLGSDGRWVEILRVADVGVAPLRAANCGVLVNWSQRFRDRFQGQPLKRIALRVGEAGVRGEALVTAGGLEGGAVYALSAQLRDATDAAGAGHLSIDLRPDIERDALLQRLDVPRAKKSLSTFLRKAAQLSPVAIGLLQEAALRMRQRPGDLTAAELASLIKDVPVAVSGMAPIERAISTAGGVAFDEVGRDLMIAKRPGVFVAGEMLDWDAPTGGYLLQASFATGAAAGRGALDWLAAQRLN